METLKSLIKGIFVDQFKAVYWLIAIATAYHTAWGAATTMQGAQGEGGVLWWLQGIAFAFAIDISMVMVAIKMRSGRSVNTIRYAITFGFVALLSTYFQLLFAWSHITALPAGAGVSADWSEKLLWLINLRLLIAPFALPGVSIFYTIAGLGKGGEKESNRNSIRSNGNPSDIRIEVPQLPAKSTLGHSKAPDAKKKVTEYYEANPDALELNPREVAKMLEVGKSTVYAVRKEMLERTSSNGHYETFEL